MNPPPPVRALAASLASALLLLASAGCGPPRSRTAGGTPDPPALYRLYCFGCHGKDGERGDPKMHLSRSASRSYGELVQIITEGRKAMPPWKGKLQADEIDAVARYAQGLAARSAR